MSHIWYNDHLKALQIVCCIVSESFYARGQDCEFFTIVKERSFSLQEVREMDEQEVERLEQLK